MFQPLLPMIHPLPHRAAHQSLPEAAPGLSIGHGGGGCVPESTGRGRDDGVSVGMFLGLPSSCGPESWGGSQGDALVFDHGLG